MNAFQRLFLSTNKNNNTQNTRIWSSKNLCVITNSKKGVPQRSKSVIGECLSLFFIDLWWYTQEGAQCTAKLWILSKYCFSIWKSTLVKYLLNKKKIKNPHLWYCEIIWVIWVTKRVISNLIAVRHKQIFTINSIYCQDDKLVRESHM